LKLVGAVAIKLRPDATGFKKDAEAKLKKEAKDLSADVELNVKADTTEAKTDVDKAKEEIERKSITLRVGLDYDSVRRAQAQLEAAINRHQQVDLKVDLNNAEEVQAALELLKEAMGNSDVRINYVQDEKGYREILARIDQIRREKAEVPIEFKTDEDGPNGLRATEAKIRALLADAAKVEIKYDPNRASLEAAIRQIDAELFKLRPVDVKVSLNEKDLLAARARLETELAFTDHIDIHYNVDQTSLNKAIAEVDAELAKFDAVDIKVNLNRNDLILKRAELEDELHQLTVRIDYDANLASLQAAKARIREMLGIGGDFHIDTKLDAVSLDEALAKIELKIKEAEQNELKIKTRLSFAEYLTTLVAIKELTKNQTVNIFTKVNDASLFLAAAKLTGLRAATLWTKEFGETIGTLDRNLPIVAAAVTGISQLSAGVLSLVGNIFSLGNGVGEVARMGALLAPALITGLASVMIIMTGVFHDFGAAINGDTKAMAKLAPAGRQAAAEIKPIFADIRQTISSNFWDQASEGMLRFVHTGLPAVGAGLGKLAGSLGSIFGTLLDTFNHTAELGGVKVFFDNMSRGFDVAHTGLSKFMDAFNILTVVGSTAFPKIGKAFNEFADKFDAWTTKIAADGTLQRWIDEGIQGFKDLWNIGVELIKIWGNLGNAAQAAGALTLHSLSDAITKLDAMTAGARFQQNMRTIFQGAGQAMDIFFKALGSLGPVFDVFSVTFKNVLVNSAQALSAFIADVGDVLSSPQLGVGFTAFLTGVKQMFVDLRPSAAYIVQILETMGKLMGQVASDVGPLFRNLFRNLADTFTTAYNALSPFLPHLMELGTTIVNVVGPAIENVARILIPAFAGGLQKVGDGLVPVIRWLGDVAVGAAQMIAAMPPGVIVGIATAILSVGTSLQFSAAVLPVVNAALKIFATTVALSEEAMTIAIPVVGLLLAALSGLVIGGIANFASQQKAATPDANAYADALQRDADAAGVLGAKIGEATTKLAIHNLVTSGAYDLAGKLGLNFSDVTNAALGNEDAMKRVNTVLVQAQDAYFKAQYAGGQFTDQIKDNKKNADDFNTILTQQNGSLKAGKTEAEQTAEALKVMGIRTNTTAVATETLAEQVAKSNKSVQDAAQVSSVLTDSLSSSTSKIDAMRKTLALLLGPNVKEQAAETLGAYVKGFNDLKDTVTPVTEDMKKLGEAAYGENGFLNVASGNKAVLQVNQALVDEVNNVWAGAKAAYDAAIKQGDTAAGAFQKANDFILQHKGDYDELAKESGVSADRVQGQWQAVFGTDWVLKVTFDGLTQATTLAQQTVALLHGNFDGQKWLAYIDANPDQAMLAIQDPVKAVQNWVDTTWEAKLTALPKPAQDAIRSQIDVTDEEWTKGDFSAILKAAKGVPGLVENLELINNGIAGPFDAIIFALNNQISLAQARQELNDLAARRTAQIDVIINRGTMSDLNGDASGTGRFGSEAIGAILDGVGRGLRGFAPIYKSFASGGIENHVAQIARPGIMPRVWAESETGGEAYLPLHPAKRVRSVAILKQVASMFGYQISKAQSFADGGTTVAPSNTSYHAPVHIGQLITTDPDAAVEALQRKRRDAMAVHNIRPF
jgi:hypothetical protein